MESQFLSSLSGRKLGSQSGLPIADGELPMADGELSDFAGSPTRRLAPSLASTRRAMPSSTGLGPISIKIWASSAMLFMPSANLTGWRIWRTQ